MAWKDLSYWLKGLLLGMIFTQIFYIGVFILFKSTFIYYLMLFAEPLSHKLMCGDFFCGGLVLVFATMILYLLIMAIFLILGTIIGWIYGKIRNG